MDNANTLDICNLPTFLAIKADKAGVNQACIQCRAIVQNQPDLMQQHLRNNHQRNHIGWQCVVCDKQATDSHMHSTAHHRSVKLEVEDTAKVCLKCRRRVRDRCTPAVACVSGDHDMVSINQFRVHFLPFTAEELPFAKYRVRDGVATYMVGEETKPVDKEAVDFLREHAEQSISGAQENAVEEEIPEERETGPEPHVSADGCYAGDKPSFNAQMTLIARQGTTKEGNVVMEGQCEMCLASQGLDLGSKAYTIRGTGAECKNKARVLANVNVNIHGDDLARPQCGNAIQLSVNKATMVSLARKGKLVGVVYTPSVPKPKPAAPKTDDIMLAENDPLVAVLGTRGPFKPAVIDAMRKTFNN